MKELLSIPDDGSTPIWKFYEPSKRTGKPVLIRIEKFTYLFPAWQRLILNGVVHRYASQLMGEEALLFKEKLILKPPGGAAIGPHQEMHTDWPLYGDSFLVAAIAIDACTSENGCLQVSSGDHKRGLIGRPELGIGTRQAEALSFREVHLRPGDCLFFDCWTPHRSGPNRTDSSRGILFLAYNRRSAGDHYARYFTRKEKEYWPGRRSKPHRAQVVRV